MFFIAVDGIDGSGKTTLVGNLTIAFRGYSPVVTKEPTQDSEWGKQLREAAHGGRLPRDIEIEYFHKDRLHHIEKIIKPALSAGRPVISDRYIDSTLAFQCETPEEADKLYERFLPEILVPDVTFILHCPVDVGLARIEARNNGRTVFERRDTLLRAQEIYRSRRGRNYVFIDTYGHSADATFSAAMDQLEIALAHLPINWAGLPRPSRPISSSKHLRVV